MRISDWSSDVCSSDLIDVHAAVPCEISASGRECGGFVVGVAMQAIAVAWPGQVEVVGYAGVDGRQGRACELVVMWFAGGETIVSVVYGPFVAKTGKSATSQKSLVHGRIGRDKPGFNP